MFATTAIAAPPSPKYISNEAYDATTWDGVKSKAPSKDAVRDLIEAGITPVYAQTVIVDQAGGQYTTIQAAIDSITDNSTTKRYAILIQPGTYTENVVMEEYVSLVGVDKKSVIITSASGITITAPSGTSDAAIHNISLKSTPTADGGEVLKMTAGELRLDLVGLDLTSATNGVEGTLINQDGGDLDIHNSNFVYTLTGSADASVQTHSIIDIDGTSNFDMAGSHVDIDIEDEDDTVIFIDEASAAAIVTHFLHNDVHMVLNHATYDGVCGFMYAHGTSALKEIVGNIVSVSTSSGTGTAYGMYMDTSGGNGVIFSTANQLHILGFGNNYGVNVAAGDVINSHFNDISAASGNAPGMAGTLAAVASPSDGNLVVTGTMSVGSTLTFGTDTLTSAELLDTLSDETGTGVAVFGTAPTFTTSITIGDAGIDETELEILDGATASTTDFNIIDGISDSGDLTAAELLYVDGVTSAIQTQLNAKVANTNPTLIGSIDMEDYLHLEVNASITNESGTGITDTVTVDAGASNEIGHCLHIDADGEWVLADADGVATMPCMAISLSASEGAIQVLRRGKMSCTSCTGWPADGETWDEGEFIYVSETSGYLTNDPTAITDENDVVQKVGIVVSINPDIVDFFFSPEMTILAAP